jgi:hypothetical protein
LQLPPLNIKAYLSMSGSGECADAEWPELALFCHAQNFYLVRFGAIWCDLLLIPLFFAVGAAMETAD